ncbi:MAG TPA: sterol desaturase family protein [Stellaceae bacterium]|nr:sterol desaturase family protein [Stellaceae bacterium]
MRLPGNAPSTVASAGAGLHKVGQPVRLFESDVLERFTRTSIVVILLFWLPVSALLIVIGARLGRFSPLTMVSVAVAGVAAWTLFEYLLHRFVFHIERWIPQAVRMSFVMHGCHHADPADASRDIMPLVGSVPISAALLGASAIVMGPASALVFMGGFGIAYLAYDVTHYACHQRQPRGAIGRYLKRHHLVHHFVDGSRNFGVTSPLWDWLFRTLRRNNRHD